MIAAPGNLIADTVRILIGWVLLDLIRWLWNRGAEDAPAPLTEYVSRCAWCNGAHVVARREKPPPEELPDGWVATDSGDIRWCCLRCWVEHWRADPRVEAPPVTIASGMWHDDWHDTESD